MGSLTSVSENSIICPSAIRLQAGSPHASLAIFSPCERSGPVFAADSVREIPDPEHFPIVH